MVKKSNDAKDIVGIPWRVAFALQADGWYLRDLEAVTHRENFLRGSHPLAILHRLNICKRGHPVNSETTYFRKDRPGRQCRVCKQERRKRAK